MNVVQDYLKYASDILEKTKKTQAENIYQAAQLVTDSCVKGGRFYVFGSGHSHLVAEELYIRAGGLAYVRAILPPVFKSSNIDGADEYNAELFDKYYGYWK